MPETLGGLVNASVISRKHRLPLQRRTVWFQNQSKDERDEDGGTRQGGGSQKLSVKAGHTPVL